MLVIKIITLAVLLIVFAQDIVSRAVYWILFPLLMVLFVSFRLLSNQQIGEIWQPVLINCSFLILQFLLVSAYFSLKKGSWINITGELLGWGDVAFLGCIAFYLPVLDFLFFYITSLIIVVVFWQLLKTKKNKTIPLAGLQALMFALFLSGDWWYLHLNVISDDWLLHLLTK